MKTLMVLTLAVLAVTPMYGAVIPTDGVELLIPVAGRAAGARGELFVTDLTLVNYSGNSQAVQLTWLPHGGTATPPSRSIILERFRFLTLVDVVGTTLGTEGVGAIVIRAFDPTNNAPSATGAIDAEARIWTESISLGIPGTVSQSVPAVRLDQWRDSSPAYIHGVRQSAAFRTNYGIVNTSSDVRYFRVLVNSARGRVEEIVTVPAFGTVHRAVPGGVGEDLSIYIEPAPGPVLTPPTSGTWRAYAASTDNQSGSGWTVIAIQPRTDVDFGGGGAPAA